MQPGATARAEQPLDGPCELLRVELSWNGLRAERAALLLRGETNAFALIGRWAGGGALIGSQPVAIAPPDADPFSLLEAVPEVTGHDPAARRAAAELGTGHSGGAVGGGWFGYLGYGLGSRIERLDPPPPPAGATLPPFSLAFYDHLLRQDAEGRWWFEALLTAKREAAIRTHLESLRARARSLSVPSGPKQEASALAAEAGGPEPRPFRTAPWCPNPEASGHRRAVAACVERIHAGDLFQANICQRLSSRLTGDPLDLFATAVPRLNPDRAAYLAGPWGAIAALSPELFLERHGRRVRTAPIKGTRPRPRDRDASVAQKRDLADSIKDRAENQMIVDMARNDLGRVCLYGSVRVETSAEVRPHTGVWHLVSEVSGELHPALGDRALLRATFPPASVTGAPKIAAQNVIAELESTRREAYTGAIGFVSPVAGLELNVTIRSFEFGPAEGPSDDPSREAWLGVGGGIVADSDPATEAEECRTKARPLLDAISAELAPETGQDSQDGRGASGSHRADAVQARPSAPRPLRFGPKPIPRPDPAAGVFETILVEDGRPIRLESHLERLAQSAAELYQLELSPDLADEVARTAASAPRSRARLRIDFRPNGEGGRPEGVVSSAATDAVRDRDRRPSAITTVTTSPLPDRPEPSLAPVCIPGGLGPHKWADRTLLERLGAAVAPHMPLICDIDGRVLEAAHAAVFAELDDGLLVTPPLDGRILPSIARAHLLEGSTPLPGHLPRPVEAPLRLADLVGARSLHITNALTLGLIKARLALVT